MNSRVGNPDCANPLESGLENNSDKNFRICLSIQIEIQWKSNQYMRYTAQITAIIIVIALFALIHIFPSQLLINVCTTAANNIKVVPDSAT